MATLESSWDLRANSSPRSLCVYPAATPPIPSLGRPSLGPQQQSGSGSNPFDNSPAVSATKNIGSNPFDVASVGSSSGSAASSSSAGYAVVFGTERGAVHCRTYAKEFSATRHAVSGRHLTQQPLGTGSLSRASPGGGTSAVHPLHQPADWNNAVSGAVVSITRAASSVFLLLVDDNRGVSSPSSPGAYASQLVALRHGTFTKLPTATTLPRMSCVSYHPTSGFVYAAGTSVHTLPAISGEDLPDPLLAGGLASTNTRSVAAASLRTGKETRGSRSKQQQPHISFLARNVLPSPGARSGQDAFTLACHGKVAVVAVGNTFYAIPGVSVSSPVSVWDDGTLEDQQQHTGEAVKVLTFTQSSQVHPPIAIDVPVPNSQSDDYDAVASTSLLFLASGRECAAVEILHDSRFYSRSGKEGSSSVGGSVAAGPARHGIATLASPILAAVGLIPNTFNSLQPRNSPRGSNNNSGGPLVAVLTSDGLVHTRSPSCIAIPLSTIEVGNQPNDFFVLRALPRRKVVAVSYSGGGRLITCRSDTPQDLADRLMKLSIDAFGANGFPRSELSEAVSSSFSATSYVGPEPTNHTRNLLRQYLEAVLGLSDDFGGDISTWHNDDEDEEEEARDGLSIHFSGFDVDDHTKNKRSALPQSTTTTSPTALLSGSALLCLVCSLLSPPAASLANRAAKSCASKMGVVSGYQHAGVNPASVQVCEAIADKLLKEASSNFSLLNVSSPSPIQSSNRSSKTGMNMEFVEAAVWLLRSCGQHVRAIEVLQERMNNPAIRNRALGGASGESGSAGYSGGGGWSQIKYESYTAAHLGELWSSGDEACSRLVLQSSAIKHLLEVNSRLGLSVFTTPHPQNARQWKTMLPENDPLRGPVHPLKVVELLKSINPATPYDGDGNKSDSVKVPKNSGSFKELSVYQKEDGSMTLSLESGRALAVTYLESAIGIASGRSIIPTDETYSSAPSDEQFQERVFDVHDELAYLLLEGIISERGDDNDEYDSDLGTIFRWKLRRLLSWPNANVRADRLLASLPSSFLREHALLLGRLGRHEDALRILYCDLKSLDFALEYCDGRYERLQLQAEQRNKRMRVNDSKEDKQDETTNCAYLPLVRVALSSDLDSERGISAAIQVLALRRGSIDLAAALRLLPKNVPVSAVARPFLIPALIDNESQVRRLTVVASLLRAKYVDLKRSLTEAQIKSQASLHAVPALRSLNLGDPFHSSKPFKARASHTPTSHFPEVTVIKHFFSRYLVLQAKVTNSAAALEGRTLGEVTFVVAESSDEALLPSMNVPLKTLPPQTTGSAWCVLVASPQRLDGTAIMACELRYTILALDTVTGVPLNFNGGIATSGLGRTYVEELQDIEVRHTEFDH